MTSTQKLNTKKVKFGIFFTCLIIVICGVYYSLQATSIQLDNIELKYLALLAGFTVPTTVLLNSAEFQQLVKLSGGQSAFMTSLKVTVVGSITNYLPLPGATIVRAAAIKTGGANWKKAVGLSLLPSMFLVTIQLLFSGFCWFLLNPGFVAVGIISMGFLSSVFLIWFCCMKKLSLNTIAMMFSIRAGLVGLETLKVFIAFSAISASITIEMAGVMGLSSFLGTAVSIVPAGLGIRELAASSISHIFAYDIYLTFLAVTLIRIVSMSVLGLLVTMLTMAGVKMDFYLLEGDKLPESRKSDSVDV